MDTGIQEQSAIESTTHQAVESRQHKILGHLAGEVCLEVHTHEALRLILGRRRTARKAPISGLIAFASAVNSIWQAADGDDPYALWWLVKIETGIEQCRAHLNDQFQETAILHPDAEVLEVDTAESEQPYRTRLAFSNPYAYRAAHMLGEYDILVRSCYTLAFVGVGNPDDLRIIVAEAGHQVRRAFAIPQGFKTCAIDRDDIRQNNERARRAVELMGPLPDEILNGETLPVFVPADIRQAPGAQSTAVTTNAPPQGLESADAAESGAAEESVL